LILGGSGASERVAADMAVNLVQKEGR